MMYISSRSTDPYENLALEQYAFETLCDDGGCVMLWQNDNTVVVGRHQNTLAEINTSFVNDRGVRVVRRMTGGGAVYHDMGNVNFTFIEPCGSYQRLDFARYSRRLADALGTIGINAEVDGRNDILFQGKKFSGNAQCVRNGRVLHHGTILFDTDIAVMAQVLNPAAEKLSSKAVDSVRARVTNLAPYLPGMTVSRLMQALAGALCGGVAPYELTPDDQTAVAALRERYASWDWNYGQSPAARFRVRERLEGCGSVEAGYDVVDGCLRNISFCGDFFSEGDPDELARQLDGARCDRATVEALLTSLDVGRYLFNATPAAVAALLVP